MNKPASILREIATLLDDGLPIPISITLYGKPSVLVRVTDLGYWLSRLDLPEPEWHGDAGCPLHARWADDAFNGCPYTIACVSTANVQVPA